MDTASGDGNKRTKNILSKFLSKKSKMNKTKKRRKRSFVDHQPEDIPIVSGILVDSMSPMMQRRKFGLSERSESDRIVVKRILKDLIIRDNLEEFVCSWT